MIDCVLLHLPIIKPKNVTCPLGKQKKSPLVQLEDPGYQTNPSLQTGCTSEHDLHSCEDNKPKKTQRLQQHSITCNGYPREAMFGLCSHHITNTVVGTQD